MTGEQPQQQTIAQETSLEGVGLHTGSEARLRFLPAEPHSGIRFRRTDLDNVEIPATLEHVHSTDRGTTLALDDAKVHTVEHLLAAIGGLRLDNLIVEIDGPEIPILDGSFKPFFDVLAAAGTRTQDAPARVIEIGQPVTARTDKGASYVAVPAERLRVSATIEFPHQLIGRQHGSYDVDDAAFAAQLAGARTFGFLSEKDSLYARGLAQGVTFDNALVLDEQGLAGGELRWPDEFVRHKAGDVVGDLTLLGGRLRAHVIADRPSHAGNVALAQAIVDAQRLRTGGGAIVDIQSIMEFLPHRYPFLLVDRIIEYEPQKRIVGIKNVTINEPFFQGHFPGHPIMPGVLIIEAMGQVGGLLLMDAVEKPEEKVVYFMGLDSVRWRRPVTPGDQIRFELELLTMRRHVCKMRGAGYVDGHLVAEAEMMARIVDR